MFVVACALAGMQDMMRRQQQLTKLTEYIARYFERQLNCAQ